METLKKDFDTVLEYLDELSANELVNVHNTYCQESGYSDDEIWANDEEFFEIFFSNKVMDAVRAISYGKYHYGDSYVMFNGYANLESFDSPNDHIDTNAIARYILENPQQFDIEFEEEEEDENDNEEE